MNKFSLILLWCFAVPALGQTPDWVTYENRARLFPKEDYLLGFSSEVVGKDYKKEALLLRLSGYAKNQLVENIVTEIKASSTLNLINLNGNSQEEFKLMSSSSSNASIAGLKVETYFEEKKKGSTGYAFAYALKSDVITYYKNEIARFVEDCNAQLAIAEDFKAQSKHEEALKTLYKIQTGFREVEHAQAVVTTLTGDFNQPALHRSEVSQLRQEVQKKINEILNTDQFSLEDAAWYISRAIKLQVGDETAPISVANFTFENSPMGSPFSRRFKAAIEQKLIAEGLPVSTRVDDTSALILYGTYWEENNRLKIITVLRTQASSQALAGSECFIPKADLTTKQIAYLPENYKTALIAEQQLAADEVTGGDLNIEIWTNKGAQNLIYVEDEKLKLFVRVNKECYIRLIYYLADGNKVLLLDNYYIDRDKVNTVYELPYTFQCAAPFGVETLQLNAQNKPFALLKFTSQYGYDFLTDDMQTILKKTRGFKRVSADEEELIQAEKRLVFTTMPK